MKISLRRFLLPIATGGLVVALFASVFYPVVANAANIVDASPDDQAKSNSYYRVLRKCFRNNLHDSIQLTATDNGNPAISKWFNGGWGYVYPEGRLDCSEIAVKARTLWGYGTDKAFYEAFFGKGAYNASTLKWTISSNGDERQNIFDSTIQSKYYNANFVGDPEQSGEARYVMFKNVFQKACLAKDLGATSSISNPSYKQWVNSAGTDSGTPINQDLANINIERPAASDNTSTVYFSKVTVAEKAEDGTYSKSVHGFAYVTANSLIEKYWNKDQSTYNLLVNIYGYSESPVARSCHQIMKGISENVDAWLAWAQEHPEAAITPPGDESGAPVEPSDIQCGIEGIGWIVCPVLTFTAAIADSSFDFLASNFLSTDTSLVESGGPTQAAWGIMRNLANIAFVIAFLFIIFSQLTGVGVSNYGVKKLLPRVVISAILVNLSFTICQLAVDLSNILGYSLKSLFDNLPFLTQTADSVVGVENASGNGFGWAAIVTVVIAAGAGILLGVTGPVLLASVLAILMIALILFARKALIVLLIVIAPLAFVAYLLPNTEQWFKKWAKLFSSLLLLFPIISVVFGASSLAAYIIKQSSPDDPMIQVIAIGVATVPLFVVPFLLKGALDATGTLGAKLSGLSSKANARIGGKAKETSRLAAYSNALKSSASMRRSRITGGVYDGKNPLARLSSGISSRLNASGITGAAGKSVASQAAALSNKLTAENVEAAKAVIETANLSGNDRQTLALGGSVMINGKKYSGGDIQRAAIDMQMKTGSYDEVHKIVSESGSSLKDHSQRIQGGLIANGWSAKSPAFAGKNLDKIAQGGIRSDADLNAAMLSAIDEGRYDAPAFAAMNNSARAKVIAAARASSDPRHLAALRAAAAGIAASAEISGKIAGNVEAMTQISSL